MTPHSVGRCPKDRGDRSQLGKPFFKRVFLNKKCKSFYMSTEVISVRCYLYYNSVFAVIFAVV